MRNREIHAIHETIMKFMKKSWNSWKNVKFMKQIMKNHDPILLYLCFPLLYRLAFRFLPDWFVSMVWQVLTDCSLKSIGGNDWFAIRHCKYNGIEYTNE